MRSLHPTATAAALVLALTALSADAQIGGSTPPRRDDGAVLFKTYCASCHGATAQGNGPMAAMLRRPPSDLTDLSWRNGGLFPAARVHRIIDGRDVGSHGTPEMPVWGSAFKLTGEADSEAEVKARIDALVRYLETIQRRRAH